jgi:hypothetical protein
VSDRPTPVGALLRAAPPDRLPEVVTEHLRRHHAAGRVEILLADLTMAGLWPLLEPGTPGGGPLPQRCFGSQRPVVDVTAAVCDRLEATGLLRRVPDPRDRREVRLLLTPAARNLLNELRECRRRALADVLERMVPARRQDLVRALTAFDAACTPADGDDEDLRSA